MIRGKAESIHPKWELAVKTIMLNYGATHIKLQFPFRATHMCATRSSVPRHIRRICFALYIKYIL